MTEGVITTGGADMQVTRAARCSGCADAILRRPAHTIKRKRHGVGHQSLREGSEPRTYETADPVEVHPLARARSVDDQVRKNNQGRMHSWVDENDRPVYHLPHVRADPGWEPAGTGPSVCHIASLEGPPIRIPVQVQGRFRDLVVDATPDDEASTRQTLVLRSRVGTVKTEPVPHTVQGKRAIEVRH
jgi:hypothetical protein